MLVHLIETGNGIRYAFDTTACAPAAVEHGLRRAKPADAHANGDTLSYSHRYRDDDPNAHANGDSDSLPHRDAHANAHTNGDITADTDAHAVQHTGADH